MSDLLTTAHDRPLPIIIEFIVLPYHNCGGDAVNLTSSKASSKRHLLLGATCSHAYKLIRGVKSTYASLNSPDANPQYASIV